MALITDGLELKKLAKEWAGAERMRDLMQKHVGGVGLPVSPADALYNLPLLLAFDVLRDALRKAKKQGLFTSESNSLRQLMEAAEDVIPWIDYKALHKGMKRRNAVAKDGELFPAAKCLQDIENVSAQLRAWGIG